MVAVRIKVQTADKKKLYSTWHQCLFVTNIREKHISLLIQTFFPHWSQYYEKRSCILVGSNGLKLKMLIDWRRVDYCVVAFSRLNSHSDGTHSLQRIHWLASDVIKKKRKEKCDCLKNYIIDQKNINEFVYAASSGNKRMFLQNVVCKCGVCVWLWVCSVSICPPHAGA